MSPSAQAPTNSRPWAHKHNKPSGPWHVPSVGWLRNRVKNCHLAWSLSASWRTDRSCRRNFSMELWMCIIVLRSLCSRLLRLWRGRNTSHESSTRSMSNCPICNLRTFNIARIAKRRNPPRLPGTSVDDQAAARPPGCGEVERELSVHAFHRA